MKDPNRYWNPYAAGVALGGVLLAAYVTMGHGVGASSASFRVGVAAVNAVAPAHVRQVPALSSAVGTRGALDDWIVFEVIGMVIGGALGAWTAGRFGREVRRGRSFGSGPRIALAVFGGVLMGFAAKLARGCTSGQALSGGALMSVGAWAFMLSVFVGGYGVAWMVRRQWR
ncbi:MAG TPA: YeeE/YedE thiosulfate transporter family protein [Anaeromyxobacter sp.]